MLWLFSPGKFVALLIFAVLLQSILSADPVPVRHMEGVVHGFLAVRTLDGKTVAAGELTQSPNGGRLTNHLVFHFRDGSIQDETAVFTERGTFLLLKYHLVQKGPTFPQQLDVSIDRASGQVTVRHSEKGGKEKVESEHMDLPLDLANGLTSTVLKNLKPADLPAKLSLLATTPKPRLVSLKITSEGKDPFSVAGLIRQATHYVIKVEIGGVKGAIAPLVGKQPPDHHMWIVGGETPGFIRSDGTFFQDGPEWRVDLASPVWPKK
jgi:hypothetical protein